MYDIVVVNFLGSNFVTQFKPEAVQQIDFLLRQTRCVGPRQKCAPDLLGIGFPTSTEALDPGGALTRVQQCGPPRLLVLSAKVAARPRMNAKFAQPSRWRPHFSLAAATAKWIVLPFFSASSSDLSTWVESKRHGKHTIDRFDRSGFALFSTIDGMTTVPASSRIGLVCQKEEL